MSMKPKHWVMVRLSAMGDVVLTTGVLEYWRREFGMTFTVITRVEWAGLYVGHPAVREVVGLQKEELGLGKLLEKWRTLVRRYEGSGLIDLHGTLRTRILGALWKGPVRRYAKMAMERRAFLTSGGRLGAERLLQWNVPQRYAMALPELCEKGVPERSELLPKVFLGEAEQSRGLKLLAGCGVAGQRPAALHPYATHANKAWDAQKWVALGKDLDNRGVPWIVVGRDAQGLDGLKQLAKKRDFTSRTSLRETCAILAGCRVLVTGDSGPMHLASAVNTPVIALFGPTTAHWGFYPAGKLDRVVERPESCRPCGLHGGAPCKKGLACLAGVQVHELVDLIARTERPSYNVKIHR